jgi:hypothetical protein
VKPGPRERCACGCGQLANPRRKFVRGHQARKRWDSITVGTRVHTDDGSGTVAEVRRWTDGWLGHKPQQHAQLLVVYDDGARAYVSPLACEVQPDELRVHEGDGAIVSMRELDTGATLTRAYQGSVLGALFRCITELRERNDWGERWRIRAISTPATIYRDLRGSRVQLDGPTVGNVYSVEVPLLSRLGALDLLDTEVRELAPPVAGGARRLA